jgi:hypothetical protein
VKNFFANCITYPEVKKRYRELAKKYHPDNLATGDAETFRFIAQQYTGIKNGTVATPAEKAWGYLKRRNQINRLLEVQQEKKLKKLWVYFAYQTTLAENGQELERQDLEYIALHLGYKPAWVEIKCKEHHL